MKRFLVLLSFLVFLSVGGASLRAVPDTGEAFVEPTFEELTQTTLIMGGLDINDPFVAEEYLKMMFCNIYRQIYKDDFTVNKIIEQIRKKFITKKEYPRTLFQVTGKLLLGKYDFKNKEFPFANKQDYENVGSVSVFVPDDFNLYCVSREGKWVSQPVFPTSINVILSQPLNIVSLKVGPEEAKKILETLERLGNEKRELYVRFRLRAQALYSSLKKGSTRTDFGGNMISVDLFYDKELTMWLASLPL